MSALRTAILMETDFDTLLRLAEIAEGNVQESIEDKTLALLRAQQMQAERPEVSIHEAALILGTLSLGKTEYTRPGKLTSELWLEKP